MIGLAQELRGRRAAVRLTRATDRSNRADAARRTRGLAHTAGGADPAGRPRPHGARRSTRHRASAGSCSGSVVAAHLPDIDDDLVPDIHRLIGQVERGERIVQPRLRHRFQVDRHGLAVSRHRLVGRERRHPLRLPHHRHRPGPGARRRSTPSSGSPRAPPPDRPGPAEGRSLAWPDRAGVDRPSRRFADARARSPRRSPRLGDEHSRLRARGQGTVEAARSPPSSASGCATSTLTTAARASMRRRR